MASTNTSVDKVISRKKLKSLILDGSQKGAKIHSLAGELGERIASAVENDHLHRGAYRLMLRLHDMEELKRNDFLRSIAIYTEMCREEGLFGDEHQGDLAEEAEAGDDKVHEANQAEADRIMREAAARADAAPKRRGRPAKATAEVQEGYSETRQ